MTLDQIVTKINEKIKPFSVKNILIGGCILAMGAGLAYDCNIRASHSKYKASQCEEYEKNQKKKESKTDLDTKGKKESPSKKKGKKSRKHRHRSKSPAQRNYQPTNYQLTRKSNDYETKCGEVKVNTYDCDGNYKNCRLKGTKTYKGNSDDITNKVKQDYKNQQNIQIEENKQPSYEKKTKSQLKIGKKDGYNLMAYYLPNGFHADKIGEKIKTITPKIETDKEKDYGKIKLAKIEQGQALIITLDNYKQGEHFIEGTINVQYSPQELGDSLPYQMGYTELNDKKVPSKIIIYSSADINDGKITVKTSLKNRFGTIEDETLEIIICDECSKL